MASCRATTEGNTPRMSWRLASLANTVSTALSQEHEVGVKWKIQRGCRVSQRRTFGVLVGGIVVEDHVDNLAGRHGALDGVEEADELLMPVPLPAAADDRAVEDVERCEQGGRAVALVVVGHGATAARLDRHARLGAVEGLNLALLVDREHHGMGRRIDIQPTMSATFVAKLGSLESLKLRT